MQYAPKFVKCLVYDCQRFMYEGRDSLAGGGQGVYVLCDNLGVNVCDGHGVG